MSNPSPLRFWFFHVLAFVLVGRGFSSNTSQTTMCANTDVVVGWDDVIDGCYNDPNYGSSSGAFGNGTPLSNTDVSITYNIVSCSLREGCWNATMTITRRCQLTDDDCNKDACAWPYRSRANQQTCKCFIDFTNVEEPTAQAVGCQAYCNSNPYAAQNMNPLDFDHSNFDPTKGSSVCQCINSDGSHLIKPYSSCSGEADCVNNPTQCNFKSSSGSGSSGSGSSGGGSSGSGSSGGSGSGSGGSGGSSGGTGSYSGGDPGSAATGGSGSSGSGSSGSSGSGSSGSGSGSSGSGSSGSGSGGSSGSGGTGTNDTGSSSTSGTGGSGSGSGGSTGTGPDYTKQLQTIIDKLGVLDSNGRFSNEKLKQILGKMDSGGYSDTNIVNELKKKYSLDDSAWFGKYGFDTNSQVAVPGDSSDGDFLSSLPGFSNGDSTANATLSGINAVWNPLKQALLDAAPDGDGCEPAWQFSADFGSPIGMVVVDLTSTKKYVDMVVTLFDFVAYTVIFFFVLYSTKSILSDIRQAQS